MNEENAIAYFELGGAFSLKAFLLSREDKIDEAEDMNREAIKAWRKVIELDPESAVAYNARQNLATLLRQQGNREEASKVIAE